MKFDNDVAKSGRWPTSCRCMCCMKRVSAGDEYIGTRPGMRYAADMPDYIVFHSRCLYSLAAKTSTATDIRFEEIKELYREGKVNVL